MTSHARTIGWSMAAGSLLAALGAACGGNVVVDGDGSGGAGAGPATTTSADVGVTASAVAVTGAVTSSGSMSTTAVTMVAVSTVAVSTGTGGSACDNDPRGCGENGGGCIECAISGPCSAAVNDCTSTQACTDFLGCVQSCPDGSCFDECAANNVEGARLYQALLVCVFCDACANDCAGQFPLGCGGERGGAPRP